jgi:hypothetical protein
MPSQAAAPGRCPAGSIGAQDPENALAPMLEVQTASRSLWLPLLPYGSSCVVSGWLMVGFCQALGLLR